MPFFFLPPWRLLCLRLCSSYLLCSSCFHLCSNLYLCGIHWHWFSNCNWKWNQKLCLCRRLCCELRYSNWLGCWNKLLSSNWIWVNEDNWVCNQLSLVLNQRVNPLPLPLLLALMHALEHGLNIDLRLETLPLNPLLELSQLHLELLLPSFPLLSLLVVPDQPQLVLLTFMLWGKLLLHAGTGSSIEFVTYSFATRSAASSIYASIASTE